MNHDLRIKALQHELRGVVGRRGIVVGDRATRRYRDGYRATGGKVAAVVRPATLLAFWRALQVLVAHDAIVIVQAANTGLTGGSSAAEGYDRPVVIVNTMRLAGIRLIRDGRQAVCLPGSTLHALERCLAPIGRTPHSVIGSSCIGASVIGGICNNSGGALVRRGPAVTDYALYARLDEQGRLTLENELGIDLGDDPEQMLAALDGDSFDESRVRDLAGRQASDGEYERRVRDVDAPTPARFNADLRCLRGASGSAGRVAVFAVRIDTFAADERVATFVLGTNDAAALTMLRRQVLKECATLPISGEYIHRDAFDLADVYGRDTVHAIKVLGTRRLPLLFALKAKIDTLADRVGARRHFADRLLQLVGRRLPDPVSPRLRELRDAYEHLLIIQTSDGGIEELKAIFAATLRDREAKVIECSPDEVQSAMLHRFAVAGAAVRYQTVHTAQVGALLALDVALARNAPDWDDAVPPDLGESIMAVAHYGHFFCHVFHRDYILSPKVDAGVVKDRLLAMLDATGAEYPAEHNVGHVYSAKPALAQFYRRLDPTNSFNPGIGRTPKGRHWSEVNDAIAG